MTAQAEGEVAIYWDTTKRQWMRTASNTPVRYLAPGPRARRAWYDGYSHGYSDAVREALELMSNKVARDSMAHILEALRECVLRQWADAEA